MSEDAIDGMTGEEIPIVKLYGTSPAILVLDEVRLHNEEMRQELINGDQSAKAEGGKE